MLDETDQTESKAAKYVVFDTETTGLFLYRDKATGQPVPADDPCQPRMASFAAIVTDEDGTEIERHSFLIKPDGWSINGTYAAQVNGLTDARLTEFGVPVDEVLDLWEGWIKAGLCVAAFNCQFDAKMMRAELRRAERPDLFEETRNVCLMRALEPYGRSGLFIRSGRVKLSTACEFFNIPLTNAHEAMADTVAAAAILRRLIADNRLPEPKIHYAKGKETAA